MIMIEVPPFAKVFPLHFRSFSYFIRTFLKKLRILIISKEDSMLIVSNVVMATMKIGINFKPFTDSDFIVKLFINLHQFQAMIKSFKNIASSIRE